jgi:hypothetical protein
MKPKNSVLPNNSVPAFVPYGAHQLTPGENSRILLLAHHTIDVSMLLAENFSFSLLRHKPNRPTKNGSNLP